jgi:hypothetical protein
MAPELESWAGVKSLGLLVQSSYDVIARLNQFVEINRKVAPLIHVAC